MLRSIARATCVAAALFATVVSARPASADTVDRARADQLTQQMNQQELEQMESGAVGPNSHADQLNGRQLDAPPPPPPPPPAWSYPPH